MNGSAAVPAWAVPYLACAEFSLTSTSTVSFAPWKLTVMTALPTATGVRAKPVTSTTVGALLETDKLPSFNSTRALPSGVNVGVTLR